MAHSVTILGIPLDAVTPAEAVSRIRSMLDAPKKHHVVTPNNEMLVAASRDKEFHAVLQKADLHLPDSTGLLLAARMTGQRLPGRVTGVDTMEKLCTSLGADHGVFFLGGRDGVGVAAAQILKQHNRNLTIAGTHEGNPSDEEAASIISRIDASGAHLLLVAFGAPAQDLWIAKHLSKLTTVRVAVGVGGTFDFLSGHISRAPKLLRMLGIEWLWRLILQPKRIGRILNAVVVFPILVLRWGKEKPHN